MMIEATPSTREQILCLLKKTPQLSAGEIAEKLQITDMAVRKHLNTLEKDQMIATFQIRQAMGRPRNVYQLTEQGEAYFPRRYADLTLDFLQDLEQLHGEEMILQLFTLRENRLVDQFRSRMSGTTWDEKVKQLAQIQDEKGYMVELEKENHEDTYVLTEYNCPIHSVSHRYLHACQSELSLFQKLLDAEVEQVECKAKGGKRCVYRIKENKVAKSN